VSLGVEFTREDVQAAASNDPWQLSEDFLAEVDVEDIAEAAVSYSQAAGEADSAGELAELATEQSVESGTVDGMSLADAEARLAQTVTDVDGAAIEQTVRILRQTVGAAEDAVQSVDDEIWADGNLSTKIAERRQDAVDELNAWYGSLGEAIADYNSNPLYEDAQDSNPIIVVHQPPGATDATSSKGYVDAESSDGINFALPASLITDIRNHHLEKAAEDADDHAEAIDEHIEEYRAELSRLGADLDAEGYDFGGSPLDIWHTPEMAEYYAEQFSEAVNAEPPDAAAIAAATWPLANIVDGLFDENGNPIGEMTAREHAFMERFFDEVSADDLATLGAIEADLLPYGSDQAARRGGGGLEDVRATVANAINAMTNPDVVAGNLVEERFGPGFTDVPESVSEYLFGYEDTIESQEDLDRFNGFGALMGHASVPPGDGFGQVQADAALSVQRFVDEYNENELDHLFLGQGQGSVLNDSPMLNTGSSGLLHSVSLNPDLSLSLMRDEEAKETLMEAYWADSDGAGKVMTVAGRQDDDIADEVIRYYADDLSRLDRSWEFDRPDEWGRHPVDTRGLQEAFGDLTLHRIDAIVGLTDEEREWGTRKDIFTGIALLDEDLNLEFKMGLHEKQQELAADWFQGELTAHETNTFDRIHTLTVELMEGEQNALEHFQTHADKQAALEHKLLTTTLAAAGGFIPGHVGTGVSYVASTLIASMDPPSPESPGVREEYLDTIGFAQEEIARHAVIAGAYEAYENDGLTPERRQFFEEAYSSAYGEGGAPELPDPGSLIEYYANENDGDSEPLSNRALNTWQDMLKLGDLTDKYEWLSPRRTGS
jgi:hypothetical protein